MSEHTRRPRQATATDVARLAGVSQPTVSRVFSKEQKVRVNEESKRRVLAAAAELGYVPNAIAQIMISGRSGIVGIVVSNYYNLFYANILYTLTNLFMAQGLRVMVFTSDPKEDLNELLQNLLQYQVDGVIVTSSALSHYVTQKWSHKGMPVVLLNGFLPGMEISAVQSDQLGSGIQMAEYLVGVGHRRFAYIGSENSPHRNYIPRQEGFLQGLQQQGIGECQILPGGYSYESGLEAGLELMRMATPPDAIFCSGDLNALGVIDAVRRCTDLVIGRDISVTGYDTPVLQELQGYGLTGLTQQIQQLCMDSIDLLRQLIEQPEQPPRLITHPMRLTIRQSSRPL